MIIKDFANSLKYFYYGLSINLLKENENSQEAGGDPLQTVPLQITQGEWALFLANEALLAAGKTAISQYVCWMVPPALFLAQKEGILPEKIRRIASFLQKHVGDFYLAASAVSAIALCFFQSMPQHAIFLCPLAIGYLDRNGWLSVPYKETIYRYYDLISPYADVILGGVALKSRAIWPAILLSFRIYLYFFPPKPPDLTPLIKDLNLTSKTAISILQQPLCLLEWETKVNQNYIYYEPAPPIPEVNLDIFYNTFNFISWNNHFDILRKKMVADQKFTTSYPGYRNMGKQEMIDIAKEWLNVCVDSVKNRRIEAGAPLSELEYEKLENYLKIIARYMQTEAGEIEKIDILFRLAIDGGTYCGPRLFQTIEELYAMCVGGSQETPFKTKLLFYLQTQRGIWLERQRKTLDGHLISLHGPILGLFDSQEMHAHNYYRYVCGQYLGLRQSSANNDLSVATDEITMSYFSTIMQKTFWSEHTVKKHLELLQTVIGTNELPNEEIYQFLQTWIEKQPVDQNQKDEWQKLLIDEEATGCTKFLGTPIEENGRISPKILIFILTEMGLFSHTTYTPSRSSH